MNKQKRFPWLPVILGVGCIAFLCLGVLIIGGGTYFFMTKGSSATTAPEPIPSFPVDAVEPTLISPAETLKPKSTVPVDLTLPTTNSFTTVEPDSTEPAVSEQKLTGNQRSDDHSIFDDFSSNALDWPVVDDGKVVLSFENQSYSIQVKEPDYYDWAYLPVNFIPYEIKFDARGPSGDQDGTFGVFCQYQDEDNYYYAEFDLANNTYVIGQALDGELIPLTEQNDSGQYWRSASALKAPPTSVNQIGVGCYLDIITLFINDQWVDEVSVSEPFDQTGDAALFVYTYDFADEDGYKVIFDNVEAWQPVQ